MGIGWVGGEVGEVGEESWGLVGGWLELVGEVGEGGLGGRGVGGLGSWGLEREVEGIGEVGGWLGVGLVERGWVGGEGLGWWRGLFLQRIQNKNNLFYLGGIFYG